MAYAIDTVNGDGSKVEFDVTFDFISRDDVEVTRIATDGARQLLTVIASGSPTGDEFVWESNDKIKVGTAPAVGEKLETKRDTTEDQQVVKWADGSYIIADDLNTSDLQLLYLIQELTDEVEVIGESTLVYRGTVDLTTDNQPPDPDNGDFYINIGAGIVLPSWAGIAGDTVVGGERIIYSREARAWEVAPPPKGQTIIADTAPAFGSRGQIWWNSDEGKPYIWYVDVDSAQWVQLQPDTVIAGSSPYTYPGGVTQTLQQRLEQYVSVKDFGAKGNGIADDTAAIQAAIDSIIARGGGTVYFPKGHYIVVSRPDNQATLPPGYDMQIEQRRSNKTLIIWNTSNISLVGEAGAVINRSGDNAISNDPEFASTVYVSQSSNVAISNLSFIGYQDDIALLDDIKSSTSGNHIDINNGSSNIRITDCYMQDGTNGISLGCNRTQNYQNLDPALPPCTEVYIDKCTIRNNEHGMILFDVDGLFISHISINRLARNGTPGAVQRGIYDHAASNVHINNVDIRGVYKVGINVPAHKTYQENVTVNNVTIQDPMTETEYTALTGKTYDYAFYSIGLRVMNNDPANARKNYQFSNIVIQNYATGVAIDPWCDMRDFVFENIEIEASFKGFTVQDYRADPKLDDPIVDGLTLDNVSMIVKSNPDFTSQQPASGLMLAFDGVSPSSGTTALATNVQVANCTVRSENRNATMRHCNATVSNSTFHQIIGLIGARNFDFNCSDGLFSLSNNRYPNTRSANKGDNVADEADLINVVDTSSNIASRYSPSGFNTGIWDYTFGARTISTVSEEGTYGASYTFEKPGKFGNWGGAIAIYQSTADPDQCGLTFFLSGSSNTQSQMIKAMNVDHKGALSVYNNFAFRPETSVDPTEPKQLTFERTDNKTITIKMMGTDNIIRSSVVTLS